MAGVGAAGVACSKIFMEAGVRQIIGVDRKGAIWEGRDDLNVAKLWFAEHTNPERREGTLSEVMPGADVFIGVSGPDLITASDIRKMAKDPIVFAMANPNPEIRPEDADGLAKVIATGRSDYPNQINNVLGLPGDLPRRARRVGHADHRGHEAGRGPAPSPRWSATRCGPTTSSRRCSTPGSVRWWPSGWPRPPWPRASAAPPPADPDVP